MVDEYKVHFIKLPRIESYDAQGILPKLRDVLREDNYECLKEALYLEIHIDQSLLIVQTIDVETGEDDGKTLTLRRADHGSQVCLFEKFLAFYVARNKNNFRALTLYNEVGQYTCEEKLLRDAVNLHNNELWLRKFDDPFGISLEEIVLNAS